MERQGRGAMVTGGSGDFGAAICVTPARTGCDLAVGYVANREGADRVARAVEASADVPAAAPNVLILEHMD